MGSSMDCKNNPCCGDRLSCFGKPKPAFSAPAQPVREGQEGKAEPGEISLVATDEDIEALEAAFCGNGDLEAIDAIDNVLISRVLTRLSVAEDTIARMDEAANEATAAYNKVSAERDEAWETYREAQSHADHWVEKFKRAESELAVIREALEPFASAANGLAPDLPDTDQVLLTVGGLPVAWITTEQLRRVAALANTADRGQEEKGNG